LLNLPSLTTMLKIFFLM